MQDPQQLLNLAMDLHRQGRLGEAEPIYRELYRRHPESTDLVHLLGLLLFESGQVAEGLVRMEEAIRLNPGAAHYHGNLGTKLVEVRQTERAIACLERALQLEPHSYQHHYNLGNALMHAAQWDRAIAAYRQTLALNPQFTLAELQLGLALHSADRTPEAIAYYQEILRRRPDDLGILINLGALLQARAQIDEAAKVFARALEVDPVNTLSLNNLAVMLKERGEIAESVRKLHRCLELSPDDAAVRSNLILSLHYDGTATDETLAEQHREWNQRHAQLAETSHANSRDPEKRLRIGYVSADLRDHVVGRALLPSFRLHDHRAFEIYCYSLGKEQALTDDFKACADVWRQVDGVSDAELLRLIKADQIDILVDLGQHTSENRLTVFAQKPAPIQISWLGCPESTGLDAIDYRISDRHLEPPHGNRLASAHEKPWLMKDSWTCHEPPEGAPEVNELPALKGDGFTFGSFNNNCKISDSTLEAWARILLATPGSRLMLLSKQGNHRSRIADFLASRGLDASRLAFADYVPATTGLRQGALLARYHRIDLALDTFPYNGMTTTLDALWMGVPVVSLVGSRNLGRAGLSLLTSAGLPEFARTSIDDYVDFAIRTSQDLTTLGRLRADLRDRLRHSPLLDAEGFTRQLETAFRQMWRGWCGQNQPNPPTHA